MSHMDQDPYDIFTYSFKMLDALNVPNITHVVWGGG